MPLTVCLLAGKGETGKEGREKYYPSVLFGDLRSTNKKKKDD